MKRTTIISMLCLVLGSMSVLAQKKDIVLHYDFKKAVGTTVKDLGPHHADAQLMNGARVEDGCLVLEAKDAYLDMTTKAGEVLRSLSDFTVYTRYYIAPEAQIKGYGYFLWAFSVLEANRDKEGPYHAYRVNEQRVETSIGGYTQETGIQRSRLTEQGKWITVLFRQAAGKGELYIDGELVGTQEGFPNHSTNFTTAPTHNWLGRAPFDGDNYLKQARISDFRIYGRYIDDKAMKKLLK